MDIQVRGKTDPLMEGKGELPLSVVLCGIGGYGLMYLSAMLDRPDSSRFRLAAVVDPFPERCGRLDDIHSRSIPFFPSLDDFFRNERADLTILSSPIQWHSRQACLGLEMGSHVLCEKPLAATVQDAARIIRSRNESGRQVAVGYQWSFSRAILALKEDILSGEFGKPIRLKTFHLWPRDEKYYRRNDWAGRKCDAAGDWILDSPANNAFAHELHNMFFLLGGRVDRSALPVEVTAELYRANPIENFDTCVCRARTADSTEIFFLVSHATERKIGPWFHFEFDRAVIRLDDTHPQITASFHDGSVRFYGHPDDDPQEKKLWDFLASIRGGAPVACGPEAGIDAGNRRLSGPDDPFTPGTRQPPNHGGGAGNGAGRMF
jgi:predicted dehydrogenase